MENGSLEESHLCLQSHIDSIRNCGVMFKLKRFSYLLDRSFGLDSLIGFEYLSLILSLKANV